MRSESQIGAPVDTGDRGVGSLCRTTSNTYDVPNLDSNDAMYVTTTDIHLALKAILNCMNRPIWIDPSTGRPNIATVTTVSTVTAVSDAGRLNNFGSTSGNAQPSLYLWVYGQERLNWAESIRRNIT